MNVTEIDYDQGCEYSWSGRHRLVKTFIGWPPDDYSCDPDDDGCTVVCLNGDCFYMEDQ